MGKTLIQLQNERLVKEYNYVLSDLEYKQEMIKDLQSDFMSQVFTALKDSELIPDDSEKAISCNKEPYITDVDEKTKKKIKHLYREISKKTHPDKDTQGIFAQENLDASEAYENNNIYALYQICDKVGVPYEIDIEDFLLIQQMIDGIRKDIQTIEESYIWLWHIAVTDDRKMILIKAFAKQHGKKII
jgi:hypothetical protein